MVFTHMATRKSLKQFSLSSEDAMVDQETLNFMSGGLARLSQDVLASMLRDLQMPLLL